MKPWVLGLLIAAGVGAVALTVYRSADQEEQAAFPQRSVVTVSRESLQTRVSETGVLQPSRTVEIKSQFSGEVAKIFVQEGERVAAGQLLAIIRQEPKEARQVAQLRANIEQERINVEKARRELTRMQALFDKGFIAKKELETAEQELQRAVVRLDLAERELLLALGGDQDLFERYMTGSLSGDRPEEFQIRSPADGTVLDLLVQRGEIITSGTATVGGGTILMRIADLTRMVVKANINEVNIARVRLGQTVDIHLDALPNRRFEGTVTAIAAQGVKEENIVTYEVTISIKHPTEDLRPMLTANIDIVTDTLDNVLTVPLEALRSVNGRDVLEVLVDGQPVRRPVRVAFRTESKAVLTEGVEEGETVVLPSFKEAQASRR